MTASRIDILLVYDPRFTGGTASAILTDAHAFHAAGLTIGLLEVTSGFFIDAGTGKNTALAALADLPGVKVIKPEACVVADTTFFHHPLTFAHQVQENAKIRSNTSVLVCHHPPFRGDGSLEYDPIATTRYIEQSFGIRPMWAPVSGVIRKHLRSFLPFIRLTNADWVNSFDTGNWMSNRPVFDGPIAVVGRHSREDPLKWPDTAADVAAHVAPREAGWKTRVMGCPEAHLNSLGANLDGWEIVPFNNEPVDYFVESLDVFSYFHSDKWVEAFGRTILEAMLMERPCVLSPSLRDTFGPTAHYANPADVHDLVRSLRTNVKATRQNCADIRERAAQQYASKAIPERLRALQNDTGSCSRLGPIQAAPITALRKLIGLKRRQRNAVSLEQAAKP
ncbi:glycosyltransferase [Shimia sp. R9_3]|uniref:glycosyltransferase n=1 Tax=Shimia sp. R9_3 TaxID=2821113 RepID=UPI001ADCACEF|nr:glycosyltransferase [Shimia sp. R9_3]MBO9403196.1 glycosyltransferase [Shimia sp. R9_3]